MTDITFWGLTASPYQLKMQAIADFRCMDWRRLPGHGRPLENLSFLRRLNKTRSRRKIERFPQRIDQLDEYPAVPYYSLDGEALFYDSTGLALHLDSLAQDDAKLLPRDPAQRFLCQLIDEAFDEFGLYMVHHHRWVTSAQTNVMGDMTADEIVSWLPAFVQRSISRRLSQRQSQRCPYLFSVSPAGFDAGVANDITPPSREGFPATHTMLDQAWRRFLAAIEQLLEQQPYLLGEQFTLADASAYGQLAMNLPDGRAAELLQEFAPLTFEWLCKIQRGEQHGSQGDLSLSTSLNSLLQCIAETFIPLMEQNERAYEKALSEGQTLFNEAAFDKGQALYEGELMGMPFRSVAKSFQVATWRELQQQWQQLSSVARTEILEKFSCLELLNSDQA